MNRTGARSPERCAQVHAQLAARLETGCAPDRLFGVFSMNISKHEQRTLHALAQGGRITLTKDDYGDIVAIDCITRDGWRLADCTLGVFRRLRRRRFIRSENAGPYRITRDGLDAVRAQGDNR